MPQVLSFQNGVMRFAADFKRATSEDLDDSSVIQEQDGENQNPDLNGDGGNVGGEVKTVVLPDDFDDLKVDDLKKFAADNEIDLGGATLKDDIKAVIVAAATPAPSAE